MALSLQDGYSLFSPAEEEKGLSSLGSSTAGLSRRGAGFVTPGEGPPQGTGVPGKTATRQDVTLQY